MALPIPQTPEQAIETLKVKAGEAGDTFTVKVSAKRGSILPSVIASVSGARLEHIASPELWLPRLVGGGDYTLQVFHDSDKAARIASLTVTLPGAPFSEVNITAVYAGDWQGPSVLVYPEPKPMQSVAPTPQYAPRSAGLTFSTGVSAPPAAPAAPVQGQFYERELAEKAADLRAREAELRLSSEAREREERTKRETELKLAEMKAAMANNSAAKAGPNIAEIIGAAAAVFGPILASLSEERKERARLEESRRAEEARLRAESERRAFEMQQEANRRFETLMLKMSEKPTGPDPMLQMLMESNRANAEANGAMMSRVIEATTAVSQMSIGMIETVADITSPPEGSPVLDAIKEGVKAISAITAGTASAARRQVKEQLKQAVPPQQPQLPPQAPQAQLPRQAPVPVGAPVVSFPAGGPVRPGAPAAPSAAPAPVPEAKVEILSPAPVVVEQTAFDGVDPRTVDLPSGFIDAVPSRLEQLVEMIYAHEDVNKVAALFVSSVTEQNHEVLSALVAAGGNPQQLLGEHLGEVWILSNMDYVEKLVVAVEEAGAAAGLVEGDEGDDVNGEVEEAKPEDVQ
jgi:hypothetical protein